LFFFLVLVRAAGLVNADITSGLVGYYPLEEGAGDFAFLIPPAKPPIWE